MNAAHTGKRQTPMTLRAKPFDATGRPHWFIRAYAALATARLSRFVSRHIAWKLDPILLRLTRGRIATTAVFPTAVLETKGARTGAHRRNAVIYFTDGTDAIIAASHAGSPTNPAWYHNLLANPDVVFGGTPMRATVITDESERQRLWPLADHVFPAYRRYREEAARSGRTIPLIRLTR
ncbi:nitroreductase/quinone reductase family protein [Nocardia heshunensis]